MADLTPTPDEAAPPSPTTSTSIKPLLPQDDELHSLSSSASDHDPDHDSSPSDWSPSSNEASEDEEGGDGEADFDMLSSREFAPPSEASTRSNVSGSDRLKLSFPDPMSSTDIGSSPAGHSPQVVPTDSEDGGMEASTASLLSIDDGVGGEYSMLLDAKPTPIVEQQEKSEWDDEESDEEENMPALVDAAGVISTTSTPPPADVDATPRLATASATSPRSFKSLIVRAPLASSSANVVESKDETVRDVGEWVRRTSASSSGSSPAASSPAASRLLDAVSGKGGMEESMASSQATVVPISRSATSSTLLPPVGVVEKLEKEETVKVAFVEPSKEEKESLRPAPSSPFSSHPFGPASPLSRLLRASPRHPATVTASLVALTALALIATFSGGGSGTGPSMPALGALQFLKGQLNGVSEGVSVGGTQWEMQQEQQGEAKREVVEVEVVAVEVVSSTNSKGEAPETYVEVVVSSPSAPTVGRRNPKSARSRGTDFVDALVAKYGLPGDLARVVMEAREVEVDVEEIAVGSEEEQKVETEKREEDDPAPPVPTHPMDESIRRHACRCKKNRATHGNVLGLPAPPSRPVLFGSNADDDADEDRKEAVSRRARSRAASVGLIGAGGEKAQTVFASSDLVPALPSPADFHSLLLSHLEALTALAGSTSRRLARRAATLTDNLSHLSYSSLSLLTVPQSLHTLDRKQRRALKHAHTAAKRLSRALKDELHRASSSATSSSLHLTLLEAQSSLAALSTRLTALLDPSAAALQLRTSQAHSKAEKHLARAARTVRWWMKVGVLKGAEEVRERRKAKEGRREARREQKRGERERKKERKEERKRA